jgi:hypothetical protein
VFQLPEMATKRLRGPERPVCVPVRLPKTHCKNLVATDAIAIYCSQPGKQNGNPGLGGLEWQSKGSS